MRRSRSRRHGELTSLVDVLFVLLFASLVHQGRVAAQGDADKAEPPPESPAENSVDPVAAAREVASRVDADRVIYMVVSAAGTVVSIEADGRPLAVEVPLLQSTQDTRVIVYNGDDDPSRRLCRIAADALGSQKLDRALVLVTTELPLRRLGYALVRGLRRDTARCLDDAGGYALVVRGDEGVADD